MRQACVDWVAAMARVRDTPEACARGLAIGFFFGVSLLWGLQIVLAVLTSHLLRGNKVLAATMTFISNPLTNVPLYGVAYFLGHLVVGGPDPMPDLTQLTSLDGLRALGLRFLVSLAIGTTLLGMLGGIAVYLSANRILAALRRRHVPCDPRPAETFPNSMRT